MNFSWWSAMSWSHGAVVTLALLLIAGAAIAFRPKRRNRRVRTVRPLPVADYSLKRARALQQLGPRYLLHTPINRRGA